MLYRYRLADLLLIFLILILSSHHQLDIFNFAIYFLNNKKETGEYLDDNEVMSYAVIL